MVAMTRAQIADPEFANKVQEGRENEIVHCIRGNQGCIGRVFKGLPIACTVNPGAGRERRFGPGTLVPADPPGRWLVAGGGPAGMKAAVSARRARACRHARRARRNELGGQVNLILRTPGRDEFGWIVRDFESRLRPSRRRRPAGHGGDGRARAASSRPTASSSPRARCRRAPVSRASTRSSSGFPESTRTTC